MTTARQAEVSTLEIQVFGFLVTFGDSMFSIARRHTAYQHDALFSELFDPPDA
jgi:hypothetical protein